MSITCQFNGRLGNIVFNIAQMIAHAKKHNLQYHIPGHAWACTNGIPSITVPNTGPAPFQPIVYNEPMDNGQPYYHEIPVKDNILFKGYYQSFRYFEEYRQDVLDAFNLPCITEYGTVSLHIRRGDCIAQPDGFPMAPTEYYKRAVLYMQAAGYNRFRVFSDDIPWCKNEFTDNNYPNAVFEYREGYSELEDYKNMVQCEHNITARSTFSLTAGWMNQNPNKIVLCPSPEQHYWWRGQNKDMFTETEKWLTQITW